MMNLSTRLGTLLLSVSLFSGCAESTKSGLISGEELYTPRYAQHFSIEKIGANSLLRIKNPWQGANEIEMQLFVSHDGSDAPEGFGGVSVEAPLGRVVCMSSSYAAFIETVDGLESITGISGGRYIYNPALRAKIADGSVRDVGYDMNTNYELIASLKPDLVLVYGVAGHNSALLDKLAELGIRAVYVGEYLENSPLGKAEWIVFFGELYGKREQAIAHFDTVSHDYLAIKEAATQQNAPRRADVMVNAPWRDTWFIPGDRNYSVQLIVDAGGRYVNEGEDSDISRPISIENMFVTAQTADIWLNPGQATSLRELVAMNPRFENARPVVSGLVYNNTKRATAEGGSDFWDSGAVYPNRVLRDMVKILHSEEPLDDESLFYFKRLK